MTRQDTPMALGTGALIAGLFVAVGAIQGYLVAEDRLHDQPGFLALQLTWVVIIPVGLLLLRLGHRAGARAHGVGAVARAGALAGLVGSAGCVMANVLLQVARQEHPLESYPGVIPAFVPQSIVVVLLAGTLLGMALGLGGALLGSWRGGRARATLA